MRSIVGEEDENLDIVLVGDAMTPLRSIGPKAHLGTALNQVVESGHEYLPVIDPNEPNAVLGLISQRQIAAEYHAEILRRRLDGDSKRLEGP